MGKRVNFTPEEDAYIVGHYYVHSSEKIAKAIGKKRNMVISRYQILIGRRVLIGRGRNRDKYRVNHERLHRDIPGMPWVTMENLDPRKYDDPHRV